ncbi:MAG TPA: hypothetical protein VIB79_18920 [Candidatus Binatia bacterium]
MIMSRQIVTTSPFKPFNRFASFKRFKQSIQLVRTEQKNASV